MEKKKCFKCQQVKPLDAFYRHPRMADGHLNKCKVCTRIDTAINRAGHDEYYLAYDRKRAKSDKRRVLRRRVTKSYRNRHPERIAAYNAVARAIKSGRLRKPVNCQGCGKKAELKAHHEDYRQRINVVWLCARCHLHHHRVRSFFGGWR